MPSNVVKGFAEKSGKSEEKVEKMWDEAKAVVMKEYPDVAEDSDRFYMLVTGVLKKMMGMKESFEDVIDNEIQKLHEMEDKKKKEKNMEETEEDEEVDDEDEEDEEDKKKMKKSKDDKKSEMEDE